MAPRASAGPTTTDHFIGGRIAVAQPRSGHRAGSDAVLLAAAVPARGGERVLDAGAGVGVAGLCLIARVPDIGVTAVEIDPDLCVLARSNATRNGFGERLEVVNADVTSPGKELRAAGLLREGYGHVIANPPFHAQGTVRAMPAKSAAHVMGEAGLGAWIRFLTAMAAPRACLTLIHRPEALGELLEHLEGRFGEIAILPLFPKQGEPATRIILRGRKSSRAPLRLFPGFVLHAADGSYTDEAEAVLRGGQALDLGT